MSFIHCNKLSFSYYDNKRVLSNINLDIEKGEFVAILGANGSGKSTLAKTFNGLVTPSENTVFVEAIDVSNSKMTLTLRQRVNMVMQNPDNQLVCSVVEEEVAFGVENLALDSKEIRQRVDFALNKVGLAEFKDHIVSKLSGGQKQKVAIAGAVAMRGKCIIFDEATSMLDPRGRKEVINIAKDLNREGITIIFITHYMQEALLADRIIVLNKGSIVGEGSGEYVFGNYELIKDSCLELPQISVLAQELGFKGIYRPEILAEKIKPVCDFKYTLDKEESKGENIISLKNISFSYDKNRVIKNVSLDIKRGELLCLIGHTGSGKSTLVQIIKSFLKAKSGNIYYKNIEYSECKDVNKSIGLVFQYPEDQIFEATVFDEVAFGARNMGLNENQVRLRVKEALDFVDIGEELYNKPPLQLSGGEKRRIAIASILVMKPEVLILDEPTAGLDPIGRRRLLNNIKNMTREGITLIMITHSMEEAGEFADIIALMDKGEIVMVDKPGEIFKDSKYLNSIGLDIPQVSQVFEILNSKGYNLPIGWNIESSVNILKRVMKL